MSTARNFVNNRKIADTQGHDVAASLPEQATEESEEVRSFIRRGSAAQIIIAVVVVLATCYLAKPVLVTILTSLLLAFILDPMVVLLGRIRIPRSVGSALAVLLFLAAIWGLSYFFYARALDFVHELPKYSTRIRQTVAKYSKQANQIQNGAESILQQQNREAVPVKVQPDSGLAAIVGKNVGTYSEIVLTLTFVPFLVYFMLTWRQHARRATIRLFGPENRNAAYVVLKRIGEMMNAFIFGNFILGLFLSFCSGVVFALLHLPYFYFLGLISGFLSLVPYLGVLLAILPPLATGIGVLHLSGALIVIFTVLGLHVFAMNVLYPKLLGKRLNLNPLAVTLALLIWGWIWGAMGLILAIPITGVIKIVCDSVDSLKPIGEWIGD